MTNREKADQVLFESTGGKVWDVFYDDSGFTFLCHDDQQGKICRLLLRHPFVIWLLLLVVVSLCLQGALYNPMMFTSVFQLLSEAFRWWGEACYFSVLVQKPDVSKETMQD